MNKVNSRVTLRLSPDLCESMPPDWRKRFLTRFRTRISREGELILHSDKYRDQPRNLADARARLTEMLLECQWPPTKRKKTRPSRGSQERRLKTKRQNSQKKQLRRKSIPKD
ncbi:MAG: aminoacyl-tRNA hydrolase [Planctomycetota bacterium]